MSDSLVHFPIYIGEALKKFIEYPTLEERGAWISIVVAMIHNDGELPQKEELFRYALIFDDKDKQCLSNALAKFKKLGLIELPYGEKEPLEKARLEFDLDTPCGLSVFVYVGCTPDANGNLIGGGGGISYGHVNSCGGGSK